MTGFYIMTTLPFHGLKQILLLTYLFPLPFSLRRFKFKRATRIVFRTQSNIYVKIFSKNSKRLSKKASSQMFNWVLNTPLGTARATNVILKPTTGIRIFFLNLKYKKLEIWKNDKTKKINKHSNSLHISTKPK